MERKLKLYRVGTTMRPSKLRPLDPARVALLKCKGVPQAKIAIRLGLAPATVSRLLSEKNDGDACKYIKPPEFDWEKVSKAERAELQLLDDVECLSPILREKLVALFGEASTRIGATVVAAGSEAAEGSAQRSALPYEFYERAARVVWELLTPASVIGITWGHTLSKLLDAARKVRLPAFYSGERLPTIIPLCGESLGATQYSILSSSALTKGFGEILTAGSVAPYWSLSMIPVFLPGPKAFKKSEVQAVRRLLQFSPAYAKIFGPSTGKEPSLAHRLDIVITSISRENEAFGIDHTDFWDTLKLRQFSKLIIGDLAGVPLAHPGASTRALSELKERWTGLQEQHLRACAKRASASAEAPAGVIVVGAGRERAPCIIEAVRRGLVNHVVVDKELGCALIDRLK